MAFLVAVLVALGTVAPPVASAIGTTAQKVICSVFGGGCGSGSAGPGSGPNAYQAVCFTSQSTKAAQLDVKIAFVRVSDNDTLVEIHRSDGSSSFILTHTGSAQAEAAIGGEFQVGKFGGEAEASAAAGGQLAGAQEWDFQTPQQAADFAKQVQSHGGWGTIAHDVVSGALPPGVSNIAGWGLDQLGIHGDGGLPTPTSKYVSAGAVGTLKANASLGTGASAALDAQLQAAGGARLITSGPQKGQVVLYINLTGNANGNLQAELFGPKTAQGQAGAGAQGKAVATVTLDKDGTPLNLTITAWGGYTTGNGAKQSVKGADAQAIQEALKKASFNINEGQGQGVQWTGSLDLKKNPQDVPAIVNVLSGSNTAGGLAQLINDFNQFGTQQVQPFQLSTSGGKVGAEGDLGIGVGAEGNSTNTNQTYTPGIIKPPGQAWGPVTCTK